VMKLYEEGKISLDKTLGDYLPVLKNFDKGSLKIHDLLLHQAGLKSWIPFYKETIDSAGGLRKDLYREAINPQFNIPVAKNLFLRSDYRDTIWSRINNSPLENKGKYVYSDLDFYYLCAVVEKITGVKIDKFADSVFYKPLGLKTMCYNPHQKMDVSNIAPTENDITFRHQLLQGYVHDPGAAMFGGVAGHAGVFSTTGDVAVVFQMLLNYGAYNGKRFFKKETVEKFIAYNSTLSRRGFGFDKPNPDSQDAGPTSGHCSGYTFGHQGFTGTCVWGDPVTGVLFVFLSNRVNPNAENGLINKLNVRTVAQDYIYEALGIPNNQNRVRIKQQQVGK
jgi:beta-N-acetylhexosaminidase